MRRAVQNALRLQRCSIRISAFTIEITTLNGQIIMFVTNRKKLGHAS